MYFKRQHSISTDATARITMSKYISQVEQHDSPSASGSRAGEVEQLYVLGIPLHKTSQSFQFLYAVSGVMLFYLVYGYVQVYMVYLFASV